MKWERSDFLVGVVVVAASLVLVGSFLWLSPVRSGHAYPVYTEFDRIDGIARHANVMLRGYNVGSVTAIEPRMDPQRGLRFRVEMSIHARLASGDSLLLPTGTVARLVPPPVIGAGHIVLDAPSDGGAPLAAGSVIPGVRTEAIVEQMQGLSTGLGDEVTATMLTARALMDSVASVMALTSTALVQTTASLPALLDGLQRQLAATEALTTDLHGQLAGLPAAALASMDSVTLLISDSRRLVHDLNETVLTTAPDVQDILANLDTTSLLLTHFVRQLSERPWRVFTGVAPPAGLVPPPSPPPAPPVDEPEAHVETAPPPGS